MLLWLVSIGDVYGRIDARQREQKACSPRMETGDCCVAEEVINLCQLGAPYGLVWLDHTAGQPPSPGPKGWAKLSWPVSLSDDNYFKKHHLSLQCSILQLWILMTVNCFDFQAESVNIKNSVLLWKSETNRDTEAGCLCECYLCRGVS